SSCSDKHGISDWHLFGRVPSGERKKVRYRQLDLASTVGVGDHVHVLMAGDTHDPITTYVFEHLAETPQQEWFSREPELELCPGFLGESGFHAVIDLVLVGSLCCQ